MSIPITIDIVQIVTFSILGNSWQIPLLFPTRIALSIAVILIRLVMIVYELISVERFSSLACQSILVHYKILQIFLSQPFSSQLLLFCEVAHY